MWLSFVTLILAFNKQIQWGSQQEVISHGHVTLHLTTVHDSFKEYNTSRNAGMAIISQHGYAIFHFATVSLSNRVTGPN